LEVKLQGTDEDRELQQIIADSTRCAYHSHGDRVCYRTKDKHLNLSHYVPCFEAVEVSRNYQTSSR